MSTNAIHATALATADALSPDDEMSPHDVAALEAFEIDRRSDAQAAGHVLDILDALDALWSDETVLPKHLAVAGLDILERVTSSLRKLTVEELS